MSDRDIVASPFVPQNRADRTNVLYKYPVVEEGLLTLHRVKLSPRAQFLGFTASIQFSLVPSGCPATFRRGTSTVGTPAVPLFRYDLTIKSQGVCEIGRSLLQVNRTRFRRR